MLKAGKSEPIGNKVLRLATALHNTCFKAWKNRRYDGGCEGCQFYLPHGCDLYGHALEWQEKIDNAKKKGGKYRVGSIQR